jgi:hypothetical protein
MAGTFLFGTDTFKMALFTSASNLGPATTTYAGVTGEVANGSGYTTGGNSVTLSQSGTQSVTVDSTDSTWTASGASLTAKFAAIYEVGGNVLCYCTLDSAGADVLTLNGSQLQVIIDNLGVFILS